MFFSSKKILDIPQVDISYKDIDTTDIININHIIKEDDNIDMKIDDIKIDDYGYIKLSNNDDKDINEAKVNQTNLNAITSQNKTEVDALVKMLIARMPTDQLMNRPTD